MCYANGLPDRVLEAVWRAHPDVIVVADLKWGSIPMITCPTVLSLCLEPVMVGEEGSATCRANPS